MSLGELGQAQEQTAATILFGILTGPRAMDISTPSASVKGIGRCGTTEQIVEVVKKVPLDRYQESFHAIANDTSFSSE
jgi:hypothetical protein